MDYQIVLRTCNGREDFRDYLVKSIPGLEVIQDKDNNAMNTFLEALHFVKNGAAVHIEDDIILTENFVLKLDKCIQKRSHNVIQFFSMRKADIEVGSRWDYGGKFMMNQCFYLPPGYSRMIFNYYKDWGKKEEHPTGYDILIADFLRGRKEKYWIHVPSLVQHRKVRSLINPRRSTLRQSKTFE